MTFHIRSADVNETNVKLLKVFCISYTTCQTFTIIGHYILIPSNTSALLFQRTGRLQLKTAIYI